jgi:DASS family divalent anion:Na+ symporter
LFAAGYIPSGQLGQFFLTGSVWCFILLGFLPKEITAQFSWGTWLMGAWVWGVVMLILTYLGIMIFFKPKQFEPVDRAVYRKMLAEMGPMKKSEKICGVVLILALVAWITQRMHGVDASVVACLAAIVLLFVQIVEPKEFISKVPWTLLVFTGTFVSMAAQFSVLKIDKWMGAVLNPYMAPIFANMYLFVFLTVLVIYVERVVISSGFTSLVVFVLLLVPLGINVGINPWVIGFIVLASVQVFFFSFQNTNYLTFYAVTGGDMITHGQAARISFLYMGSSLIALLASVPLWQMLGLMP